MLTLRRHAGTRRGPFRPWNRWLAHREPPAEPDRVLTDDGVSLAVYRIPSMERPSQGAVLLLHGLSANRYSFHFPGRSIATYLAKLGYDCYVPELRAAGTSAQPKRLWGLSDYLHRDLPAIVAHVLASSGKRRLHWVGHSLGGLLLLLYAAEAAQPIIASGVTIGTGFDYAAGGSAFERFLALRPLVQRLGAIPYGSFMHLIAPGVGRFSTGVERFSLWPKNIEPKIARRVFANAFEPISSTLLLDLATAYEVGGLRCKETGRYYSELIMGIDVPICMLGGSRDPQCPMDVVQDTAARLPNAEFVPYGREYGHIEDYGHFDLLLGERARTEVWPVIARWIGDHN